MSLKSKLIIQSLVNPVFTKLVKIAPKLFLTNSKVEKPTGPYMVGTTYVEFEKKGQLENSCRVSGKVWYPAKKNVGNCEKAYEHLSNSDYPKLIQSINGTASQITERLSEVCTNSYTRSAPIDCDSNTLPIVIFSHGFGMMLNSNISLFEHLASHGFVVFSIAHNDFSTLCEFLDGERIPFNPTRARVFTNGDLIKKVLPILQSETLAGRKAATRVWSSDEEQVAVHEEWVSNIRSCIDSLEIRSMKVDGVDILSKLNLNEISLVGMSFGGSASVLAAHIDSRVKQAVNLDGGQVGLELFETNVTKPLLVLHSNDISFKTEGTFNDFHYEANGINHVPVERFVLNGASHNDFTDLALINGYLASKFFMLGKTPGKATSKTINTLVLEFLKANIGNPDIAHVNLAEFRNIAFNLPNVQRVSGNFSFEVKSGELTHEHL